MAYKDFLDSETLRLQQQRAGAQAAVSQAAQQLGHVDGADAVAARNQQLLLEQIRERALAELNRIDADLRRIELQRLELQAQAPQRPEQEPAPRQPANEEIERQANRDRDAAQAEAARAEAARAEEARKAEFADKERRDREFFEQQERERQAAFAQPAHAVQDPPQPPPGRGANDPISDVASELAFAAVNVADTALEIKQALEFEAEKRALAEKHRQENERRDELLEQRRKEFDDAVLKRGADDQKLKELQAERERIVADIKRQDEERQERERQELAARQALEAQQRSARAATYGLSL